jgi:hypothetical protein
MFEPLESRIAQHFLKIPAHESSFAVVNAEAFWSTVGETHLRFDLLFRALKAVGVGCSAVAGDHAVERDIVKTTRALAHLVAALRMPQIHRFGLLRLFGFVTFGRFALDLLLGGVEFLGDLAASLDQDQFGALLDTSFTDL